MNYWLDLFTGTTWDEFRKYGAKVSGFRHRMRGCVDTVKPGDIFLCYLTKVMLWVGALEVIGLSDDKTRIWGHDEYPVRFSVRPILELVRCWPFLGFGWRWATIWGQTMGWVERKSPY